ncbi:type III pantothenate kinase [Synechococcus sp. CS-1325]|uniref:type III pantothenate kinase n=1 Tax=unclassified Synechococcus TaxID=2626047 RepID=UPI000DB1E8FA|nr:MULTISPECIES: type III pantothenate kinase [unclassified Synechococcus]MCT0199758.1 type III pantothenate kinase [Synechococcus sp. CS-1325]MCT0214222.1 type III pantothenate kinase [Synechococcus sp. CS-1326]MCT0232552.1 type III pantothenate kinase [Synechococcus sp. CS-1327]PZV01079.1 MAG: type III pantothenate kinase [Cyanobium sp.]
MDGTGEAAGPFSGRWLLIGNSRWHWGEPQQTASLRCWHTAMPAAASVIDLGRLRSWACVGSLPPSIQLPPERRLSLDQIPLKAMPVWLGVDRALAGWQAWHRQQAGAGGAVLVADAGTALSLTLVDGSGAFAGGRLMAGLRLQLSALASATAQLPSLTPPAASADLQSWPVATDAAMMTGCLWGLTAAIAQAVAAVPADAPTRLWLTGGDADHLAPLLSQLGERFELAPHLCLEALAALRPAEDR